MLDFRNLLKLVGLDPARTLIVRCAPVEKSIRRIAATRKPWTDFAYYAEVRG